jgi:hypothetical protein
MFSLSIRAAISSVPDARAANAPVKTAAARLYYGLYWVGSCLSGVFRDAQAGLLPGRHNCQRGAQECVRHYGPR